MKKGLCFILSAVILMTTFCACDIVKKNSNSDVVTYTDTDGNTYYYKTDSDGKAVTDKDGNNVTTTTAANDGSQMTVCVTDESGQNVTDANGNLVTKVITISTTSATTTASTKKGETTKKTTTTKKSDSSASDTGSSKNDLIPSGSSTSKTSLKKTVVDPIVNTKKFTIVGNLISDGNKIPVEFTFNGDNFAAKMTVTESGMTLSMTVMKKSGKYYALIPVMGVYGELDKSMFSEYEANAGSLLEEQTYQKTTTVTYNKTKYTCETYKSKSGVISKYYFDSKKAWKRWEIVDGDSISVFTISSFTKGADSDLFTISKSLKKYDFSQMLS